MDHHLVRTGAAVAGHKEITARHDILICQVLVYIALLPQDGLDAAAAAVVPVVVTGNHVLFAGIAFQDVELRVQAPLRLLAVVGVGLGQAVHVHVVAQEDGGALHSRLLHLLPHQDHRGLPFRVRRTYVADQEHGIYGFVLRVGHILPPVGCFAAVERLVGDAAGCEGKA